MSQSILLFLVTTFLIIPNGYAKVQSTFWLNTGYDGVSGFTQTPQGGSAGSTSFERPTFAEVNLSHDKFISLGAEFSYRDYFAALNYTPLHPHSQAILSQSLITHAKTIPAGSPFNFSARYDWLTFALGKNWYFAQQKWLIAPSVLANALKFNYQFSSPTASSARGYQSFSPAVGIKIKHFASAKLSASLTATISLPVTNQRISLLAGEIEYQLVEILGAQIAPTASMGLFRIDFKDKQLVPNHFRYSATPYATLGLKVILP